MTATLATPATMATPAALTTPAAPVRLPQPRRYLMCRPTHFAIEYAINPWMNLDARVDTALAVRQWEGLRRTYLDLGHTVDLIDPLPGLPDMVFAANGGLVIGGDVMPARFHHAERAAEGPAYREWFRRNGFRIVDSSAVNEGEGDFLLAGRYPLAGTGFRTDPRSHADAQELLGRPVISLRLVDPRYYHLDTALAVLDGETIAYYPGAFSPGSLAALRRLFPDAVIADSSTAEVLGLNAVSDGRHVVLSAAATRLAAQLTERGFVPVPVDLSELLKAGGGAKCCTLEIRS